MERDLVEITPRSAFDTVLDLTPFVCPMCHRSFPRGKPSTTPAAESEQEIEQHVIEKHKAAICTVKEQQPFEFNLQVKIASKPSVKSALVLLKREGGFSTFLAVCVQDNVNQVMTIVVYRIHGDILAAHIRAKVDEQQFSWDGMPLESSVPLDGALLRGNNFRANLKEAIEKSESGTTTVEVEMNVESLD